MGYKKHKILIIALITAIAAGSAVLVGCSKGKTETEVRTDNTKTEKEGTENIVDSDDSFSGGVEFEEENEGAAIEKADAEDSEFFGKWLAPSDMADYLYGNVEIEIKDDGTWVGNITETDFTGTWKREGKNIRIVSDDDDIDFLLAFTKDGKLIMQRDISEEEDGSEYVNTVLRKSK